MAEPVRVLVVDDAAESREILGRALALDDQIEVVGEAGSGPEAVRQTEALRPNVVLMDVRMPAGDGIAATEEITRRFREVQVIALTAHDDHDSVRDMLTAGASGYLVKGAPVDELMAAIRRAGAGEAEVDRRVLPTVLEDLRTLLKEERARRAEAERLAQAREDFIQVLSHELRTPLTVIGGALQYLRSDRLADDARELLEAALHRTHDLERMVEGLELIGQGSASGPQTANPAEAVGRALQLMEERPDSVEAPDETWPGVNPSHLVRVAYELAANALRHGRRPVRVRLHREGGEAVIEVTDSGQFDLEPRLFDAFVQGDMSMKRQLGGLGLGLFVARRLCELGGGRLDVRSEARGTVAEARFPMSP